MVKNRELFLLHCHLHLTDDTSEFRNSIWRE